MSIATFLAASARDPAVWRPSRNAAAAFREFVKRPEVFHEIAEKPARTEG